MESQEQDLHLIEDAVESEIASVASYSKGELYSPWIEDTDLTPYLTKFAILQRAREAAKFEAALGEWTKRAFDNLAIIKRLEARIAELEQDRDEWKDATIYANARFKIAEDRVAELERQNDDHVAAIGQLTTDVAELEQNLNKAEINFPKNKNQATTTLVNLC